MQWGILDCSVKPRETKEFRKYNYRACILNFTCSGGWSRILLKENGYLGYTNKQQLRSCTTTHRFMSINNPWLKQFLASSTSHSSTRNLVTESLQTTVILLQLPLKCFPVTVDSSWRFSGIKFTEIWVFFGLSEKGKRAVSVRHQFLIATQLCVIYDDLERLTIVCQNNCSFA